MPREKISRLMARKTFCCLPLGLCFDSFGMENKLIDNQRGECHAWEARFLLMAWRHLPHDTNGEFCNLNCRKFLGEDTKWIVPEEKSLQPRYHTEHEDDVRRKWINVSFEYISVYTWAIFRLMGTDWLPLWEEFFKFRFEVASKRQNCLEYNF